MHKTEPEKSGGLVTRYSSIVSSFLSLSKSQDLHNNKVWLSVFYLKQLLLKEKILEFVSKDE